MFDKVKFVVSRLLLPFSIIFLSLVVEKYLFLHFFLEKIADMLLIIGSILAIVRIVDIFYLSGEIGYRRAFELPELFKSLTSFLIWIISFIGVVLYYTDDISSYTGVFATSSVMIAIVGFAVRNLVADFFSGITLGLETPFRIGDWIEPEPGLIGKVKEMSWRSTKIVTKDNVNIIIPNSQLSSITFRNYNLPDPCFRTSFQVTLDYDVTAYQAHRTLLSAANEVPEIRNSCKKPDLKIKEFNINGVLWELRFWLKDYYEIDNLLFEIQKNILRNLHFSNLKISTAKLSILRNTSEYEHSEIVHILHNIDIFETLNSEELEILADNAKRHLVAANKTIVNEGDSGDSLYLVSEGLLSVLAKKEDGSQMEIETLRAGMFFGETSLLTNEKRTATVVAAVDSILYEVPKDAMQKVLESNRALAKKFSRIMAKKQISQVRKVVKQEKEDEALLEQTSESYLKKIFTFFKLQK